MRCTRHLVAGLMAFRNVLVAADVTQWMTEWSTTTCWSTKEAETMWSTAYSTTTCWSTSTPPPVTVYDTITSSKTVEVPYTTTSVIEKDFTTTVYSSFAKLITSVETSVATVTKVLVSTVTVASVATSVSIVPGKGYTSTIIIHNTETITQACFTPTPTLTGLVVCPSRITNEQGYAPPTPLPSTYLWGCPPGKLCKPKQINCNFEAGLYASTYICAPEDCIVAEKPPPIDEFGGPYADDYNSTCAFFQTFDDYPLINPSVFGLGYYEYAVSSLSISASSCPPATPIPPPKTTTTTTTTPSPVYVPPPSSTTQYHTWTQSPAYVPPPSSSTWSAYVPPPSSSTWASYVPPAPAVSSSSWQGWAQSSSAEAYSSGWAQSSSAEAYSSGWDKGSATKTWSYGVTPRALAARAGVTAPAICQRVCDACAVDAQFAAKVYASLCDPSASFQAASASCQACINTHKTDQPKQLQVIITNLNQFLDVCSSGPPKSTTVSVASEVTTTSKVIPATPTPQVTTATPTPQVTTATTTPQVSETTSQTSAAPPAGTASSPGTPVITPPTSATTTSANTSVATYKSGNGAQATQRPAAVMVIGVAVIIAMV